MAVNWHAHFACSWVLNALAVAVVSERLHGLCTGSVIDVSLFGDLDQSLDFLSLFGYPYVDISGNLLHQLFKNTVQILPLC